MPDRAGRVGILVATLLLAPPATVWAGSSQALLGVGAVVPARCAIRTPDSLEMSQLPASPSRGAVAMRCTKGTLPVGGAARAGAVGPRVSRDLVLTGTSTAPRPLAETARSGSLVTTPRLIVTVNF